MTFSARLRKIESQVTIIVYNKKKGYYTLLHHNLKFIKKSLNMKNN